VGAKMDPDEDEAFYSKLLNDMVTFVGVLSPDGTVIFVNNTPLELAGITLEDVKGKKFYDTYWWAYSEDARERIKADIATCAGGKRLIHEIQVQTADGSLIWIEFSMHPVFDEAGNLRYLVAEGRDVSEKKQALEDAQQKVAYLDNMPTYMAVTDLEGRLQFTSAVTIEKFGIKLEDVLGTRFDQMPWWEYSEEIQQKMKDVYERAAKGEKFEFEVDVKMGEDLYPIKYTCEPLRDENGNIYALLHTGTRIDELRAALDDAKEKVMYLENAPIPIIAVDKDITIKFINRAGAEAMGMRPEDAIGKKCYEVFDTPECGTDRCCIIQIMDQGRAIRGETHLRGVKEMDIQFTCAPLVDDDGNIIGGLKYIADITDLKRLMKERERLSEEIMRVSTPVIEVWEKVLLLPLIGRIETGRAEQIMERLLGAIVKQGAEAVILDVSGIPKIDADVAQHLVKTVRAAQILGSRVILTGIRPDMADTITSIGIDLTDVDTRRTLREGLMDAIPLVEK